MEDGSRVIKANVNRISVASADHVGEFDCRIDSPLRRSSIHFMDNLELSTLFSLYISYSPLSNI